MDELLKVKQKINKVNVYHRVHRYIVNHYISPFVREIPEEFKKWVFEHLEQDEILPEWYGNSATFTINCESITLFDSWTLGFDSWLGLYGWNFKCKISASGVVLVLLNHGCHVDRGVDYVDRGVDYYVKWEENVITTIKNFTDGDEHPCGPAVRLKSIDSIDIRSNCAVKIKVTFRMVKKVVMN